ncbi:MAG: SUMF1/EgtB/PvdO family nonheme iron enzyme [Candidatus Brocadiae bacterium]|nr:SUMF1/EgtB/PvdO family nonheme iron enzyme [Candidatus Brocadiia bacterium]
MQEYFQKVSKCTAYMMAPIAQGIWESEGNNGIEHVVNALQEYFQTSPVLKQALLESYDKALTTIELSLIGPSLYHKLKGFSEKFRQDILLPALKESKEEESQFVTKCLWEIKKLRRDNVFELKEKDIEQLSIDVACYMVQDNATLLALKQQAKKAAQDFVRIFSPDSSLFYLLNYENLFVACPSMYFGMELQNDARLFRCFYLTNRYGLHYDLEKIAAKLQAAKEIRDRELFRELSEAKQTLLRIEEELSFGLEHVKEEIIATLTEDFIQWEGYFNEIVENFHLLSSLSKDTIVEISKVGNSVELQSMMTEIEKLKEEICEFKLQKGMKAQSKLSDSFAIRPTEVNKVKDFFGRFQNFEIKTEPETLLNIKIELGSLLTAIGNVEEAEKILLDAQSECSDTSLKALIAYNRFINFTQSGDFKSAYTAYMLAMDLGGNTLQLFETRKYRPQQILGAGGFGVVFLCLSKVWGPVVVKSLLRPESDVNTVIENAKSLAKTDSPYIIGLKDYGYLDWENQEKPFIVMDYFSGENLQSYIMDHGPFSVEKALKIANAIASGLREAHEKGVIHRDLKPANILYQEDDEGFELKVIDFDLALQGKDLQEMAISIRATGEKSVLGQAITGTVRYAPPEQMGEIVDGKLWEIGPHSDVFAFARTLKYMLFGTLDPHPRDLRKFSNEKLLDLIGDCEAKNPLQRPQDFAQVLKRLESIQSIDSLAETTVSSSKKEVLSALNRVEEESLYFPERTGISLAQAIQEIPEEELGHNGEEELFLIIQSVPGTKYPAGYILEVKKMGFIHKGKVLQKAEIVISDQEESNTIEYPQNIENPFKELEAFDLKEESLDDYFVIIQEPHNSIPEGEVIRLISKGLIVDGKMQTKAKIVVSTGKGKSEFHFPSKIGITLKEAHEEIQDKLEDLEMLEYAIQVDTEQYASTPANTICNILTEGIIKAGKLEQASVVVISKGKKPEISTLKSPKMDLKSQLKVAKPYKSEDAKKNPPTKSNIPALVPKKQTTNKLELLEIPGFTFTQHATYICGVKEMTVPEYLHEGTGMEFVLLSGGEFVMGSKSPLEIAHTVTLSPYLISKYLCTQEQWERVMGNNPSYFRAEKNPVEWISWKDCQEFCTRTGLELPTEAQWEYACRANSTSIYCFGDDLAFLEEYAWYDQNSQEKTHPVGEKRPNAMGLYDMHGNLWELCADCCKWQNQAFTDTYIEGITDPLCKEGNNRIVRGGCWYFPPSYCRSSMRYSVSATDRLSCVGARFAKMLQDEKEKLN